VLCAAWQYRGSFAIARIPRQRVSRRVALRVTFGFQRWIWEAVFSALTPQGMINPGKKFKLKQYTGAEISVDFWLRICLVVTQAGIFWT